MNNQFITYDRIDLKYESAETVVKLIKEALDKYGKENVIFDHDAYEEYGSPSCDVYLTCKREMTPLEKEEHQVSIAREEARRQTADRLRYEQLKKQFESK